MRKIKQIAVAVCVLALAACNQKVPAGYAGIKFDLYGSEKGVQEELVGPGKYWIGMNEELILYPTFSQNYTWDGKESMSFQTREGLVVNADVGISYSLDPQKIPLIFQKYRKGVDEITSVYLRNIVRDALVTVSSNMKIDSVYGTGKVEMLEKSVKIVRDKVSEIGIEVENIFWVGQFRLPETVEQTINKKIEATQVSLQRDIEVQTAVAEAKRLREQALGEAQAIEIRARAEAHANQIVTESITKNLIDYEAVKKWDGKLPGVTGGATPFIQLNEK